MYRCIGIAKECDSLYGSLPQRVIGEILRGLVVLDSEFGTERNYFESGGYSLIATTEEDLCRARMVFDDRFHSCEWATRLGDSGYISALYLLSNEVSVMLYTKERFANKDIIENLED